MKTIAPGSNKLTMISTPVVIAILLTLMLVLAALWVGTQPLSKGEARVAPVYISALLAMHGSATLLAS